MLPHAFSRGRCIVCGEYETTNAVERGCSGHSPLLQPRTDDPVNHPHHYTTHPSGLECIQVTRHMNFNLGNAVKYIWRASSGHRPVTEAMRDIEKAIWYLKDELVQCLTKPSPGVLTMPDGTTTNGEPRTTPF